MTGIRFYSKEDYQLVDSEVVRDRFFASVANAEVEELHVEVLWRRALAGDEEMWDLIKGLCDVEIVKDDAGFEF